MSEVDRMLRTDPASAYAEMDFATRNRYRAGDRAHREAERGCRSVRSPKARSELASEAAARAEADDVEIRDAHT